MSRSLSEAFPGFDGILVVAGTQIGGKGFLQLSIFNFIKTGRC